MAVKEESEHIDIVIVVSVAVVMNVVSIVYMSHCIAIAYSHKHHAQHMAWAKLQG